MIRDVAKYLYIQKMKTREAFLLKYIIKLKTEQADGASNYRFLMYLKFPRMKVLLLILQLHSLQLFAVYNRLSSINTCSSQIACVLNINLAEQSYAISDLLRLFVGKHVINYGCYACIIMILITIILITINEAVVLSQKIPWIWDLISFKQRFIECLLLARYPSDLLGYISE